MFDLAAIRYRPEEASDLDAIDIITDEAFGPGRYTRAAERVRELAAYDPALSYVADFSGEIVGSVRQTKIRVGNAPALMLGPLAVRPFLKGSAPPILRHVAKNLEVARPGATRGALNTHGPKVSEVSSWRGEPVGGL